jgi:hypothetical protein
MAAEKVVSRISGVFWDALGGDRSGRPNFSAPNFNGMLKCELALHQKVEGCSIDNAFGQAV